MSDFSELPIEALDNDIAILGKKGGGKTYTSKGIVERLLDMGRRVLILDPLGVWAGLRTAADGKSPGYPVAIFGGEHADLPLDPAAAAALAGVIARENLPAVVDLSELSKSQQGLFLFRFLGELRKVNREALTIVLEEADVFAPQNPQGDDSKALHNEIDWIARRGRYRGFRLITITQRPARLSKDVLTQCSTLIAHRLPAPQDRDAIKAWVDGNGDRDQAKEVFDTLAGLKIGEAWVWSPEHSLLQRMRFPKIKTLDTSSTPKAGEARVDVKTLAQVDLTGIKAALAEAAAAEKKEKAKPTAGVVAVNPKAIEEAYERGKREGWEKGVKAGFHDGFMIRGERFSQIVETLRDLVEQYGPDAAAADGKTTLESSATDVSTSKTSEVSDPIIHQIRPDRRRMVDAGAGMPTVAGRIIDAIDMKPARPFTWTQVAMLAGYSESGGQFRRGKKWLTETGAVIEEGGRVRIAKPSGKASAPAGEDLVRFWQGKLPGVGAAILGRLWVAPSVRHSVEKVAGVLNYSASGGQFRRGVKSLRDACIAENSGDTIALTAEFRELAGLL